jgi:hypothetical protein
VEYLILAWILDRAQFKIAAPSYPNTYCYYVTIDDVNARKALSPVQYRVLIPWLVAAIESWFPRLKPKRLVWVYEPLHIGLLTLMLYSVDLAIGRTGAWAFATMLGATWQYAYWDYAAEVIGLSLALTGDPRLALLGGLIAALSRETAPLVAITYTLVTGDIGHGLQLLAAICAVLLGVRLWAGHKTLYCDRVLWRANWRDIQRIWRNRPAYLGEISMSLLVAALTLYAVVSGAAGSAWPVPLALLVLGWVMARASETRVFAGCLVWVAMLF